MPTLQQPDNASADEHKWDYTSQDDKDFVLLDHGAPDQKDPSPATAKQRKVPLSIAERMRRAQKVKARLSKRRVPTLEFMSMKMAQYPMLNKFEEATGIPKRWVPIVLFTLIVLLIFWGVGMPLVCAVVGFVFPIQQSFKALKKVSSDPQEINSIKYWLKFWIVWMTFTVLETVSDELFQWIPFYFAFKFILLLWCFLPSYKGANAIYKYSIHKVLSSHQVRIESTVVMALKATKQYITAVRSRVRNNTKTVTAGMRDQMYAQGKALVEWRQQRARAVSLAQERDQKHTDRSTALPAVGDTLAPVADAEEEAPVSGEASEEAGTQQQEAPEGTQQQTLDVTE